MSAAYMWPSSTYVHERKTACAFDPPASEDGRCTGLHALQTIMVADSHVQFALQRKGNTELGNLWWWGGVDIARSGWLLHVHTDVVTSPRSTTGANSTTWLRGWETKTRRRYFSDADVLIQTNNKHEEVCRSTSLLPVLAQR